MVAWYFKVVVVAALIVGAWFYQVELFSAARDAVQHGFLDLAWLWLVVFAFVFWKLGTHK